MSSPLRAVLFDVGGVLLEVVGHDPVRTTAEWMALPAVRDYLGPDATPEKVTGFCYSYITDHVTHDPDCLSRDYWTTIRDMFQALTGKRPPFEVLDSNADHFSRRAEAPHSRPIPGAREALEAVRARGLLIGLISNVFHPGLLYRRILDREGLFDYFDYTLFSSEFPVRKPHPDIFLHAAKMLGVEPEECLYIGDTFDTDIVGAQGVGMGTLWINRKADRDPDRLAATPHVAGTLETPAYLAGVE